MPRSRTSAGRSGPASSLLETAERMVSQIQALGREIAALREENDVLRVELRDAIVMFERANAALEAAPGRGRGRGRAAETEAGAARRRSAGPGRRRGRRGRATPAEVTPQVVRATIGKLGPSTASEIAAEISRAGTPVSGRAVRFLAERAGARVTVAEDGQRRYEL